MQPKTPEQKGFTRAVASQGEGGTQISEVLRLHGLRQGRYFGLKKTDLQAVTRATMVNAKRLLPNRGRCRARGRPKGGAGCLR